MYEYTLFFQCNLAAWNSAAAKVENSINGFLEGMPEKVSIRAESPIIQTITSPIELPHDKLMEAGKIAAEIYNKQPALSKFQFTFDRYELRITVEKKAE